MKSTLQASLANIALVDDCPGDIEYVKCILKKYNVKFNLEIYRDGQEILDRLYKNGKYINVAHPDLIMLDLNIPKIRGMGILKIMSKDKTLNQLKVFVLSSSAFLDDAKQCYKYGALSFMQKPFNINLFLKIIDNIEGFILNAEEDVLHIYKCR